ncbi:MAG: hydrogenase nickel incorporation protein HypA [Elusimicrobiota bacterium]
MHEWALAESVIKTLKTEKRNIHSAEVVFGQLQDIDREIFSFALKELMAQEKKSSVKIKIVDEKALFECRSCGKKFDIEKVLSDPCEKENVHFLPEMVKAFLKCPDCSSRDFEILKGRGLSLRIKEK